MTAHLRPSLRLQAREREAAVLLTAAPEAGTHR